MLYELNISSKTSLYSMEHNYTNLHLQKTNISPGSYLVYSTSFRALDFHIVIRSRVSLGFTSAVLAGASSALSNYFYPRKKSEPVKTLDNGTGTGLKEAQGDNTGLARI